MKTQIKNLVNGSTSKKIARVDDNAQVTGSSFEERAALKGKIEDENPSTLKVALYGVVVSLSAKMSCSGRNNGWSAIISEKDAEAILGFVPEHTYEISYRLTIDASLMVEVSWSTRRNERCEWKPSGSLFIREQDVTII